MDLMRAIHTFLLLFQEDAVSGLIRPETLAAADAVRQRLRPALRLIPS